MGQFYEYNFFLNRGKKYIRVGEEGSLVLKNSVIVLLRDEVNIESIAAYFSLHYYDIDPVSGFIFSDIVSNEYFNLNHFYWVTEFPYTMFVSIQYYAMFKCLERHNFIL